jgi:5'-nucleotidase
MTACRFCAAPRQFGIAHLLAVRQPDSRGQARDTEEFSAFEDYLELTREIGSK